MQINMTTFAGRTRALPSRNAAESFFVGLAERTKRPSQLDWGRDDESHVGNTQPIPPFGSSLDVETTDI